MELKINIEADLLFLKKVERPRVPEKIGLMLPNSLHAFSEKLIILGNIQIHT